MNWKTASHQLKFPVETDTGTIAKVTLREPDVDALEAIDELGIEPGKPMRIRQIRGIIVALSGLADEAVGRMNRQDLAVLGELLVPLLAEDTTKEAEKPKAS